MKTQIELHAGLEIVHDKKIVNEQIEILKNKIVKIEELLVSSGETFMLDLEMYEYFKNKINKRNIENQRPLVFSTGYWTNKN